MNFLNITEKYYSKWIGMDDILSKMKQGVQFIYSSERNKVPYGYSEQFDLFVFYQQDRIIFSYGDKLKGRISEIEKQIDIPITIKDIQIKINHISHIKLSHQIKYIYNEIPHQPLGSSRSLTTDEYSLYYDFFTNINPYCKNTDWLKEYFNEMVSQNLCYGLLMDGKIVSCSDTPSMPYLQEDVQEIGINTLQSYRGKGYATDVCISTVKEMIHKNKCPLWSTSADNIVSQKLAEKVGFVKYADILTITLP